MPNPISFLSASSELNHAVLRVQSITGQEQLSHPYAYEVVFEIDEEGGLTLETIEDVLRSRCLLRFGSDNHVEIQGIVNHVTMETTASTHPIRYKVGVVPRLWLLSQNTRSRIFMELNVPDVVKKVLEEDIGLVSGTDFIFELLETYPVSEYIVQYQETDLDFVHRLLEHHGIGYFFEQAPDGEQIIFSDSNKNFVPYADDTPLVYEPGGENQLQPVVRDFSFTLNPKPAVVVLRDYNWRTPQIALQSEQVTDENTGRGLYNRYGAHFKDPTAGTALAKVRSEELLVSRQVFQGVCTSQDLAPGAIITLVNHPVGDLNAEYVVTETSHEVRPDIIQDAGGGIGYRKRFKAIAKDTVFRPARVTPKPKIEGFMHATVDGESPGTAAPIDEYGRYKIIFPFDLSAPADRGDEGETGGKASRWVRLAQPSSGAGYGVHFPLHIGAEVAVIHMDGDPDRPLIVNSPPNAQTITPVNQTNSTQNQIRTKAGIIMTWDDDCPSESTA